MFQKNELLAEKQGSVVDETSGEPIPGAFVIINWVTNSNGVAGVVGGGQWWDLQEIRTTDADGKFSIDARKWKIGYVQRRDVH